MGYHQFKKKFTEVSIPLEDNGRFECLWGDHLAYLDDATSTTGFDAHYIYHPAWAARRIKVNQPEKHTDIGSTISFVAQLSAFVPVEFYDYRPSPLTLSGLRSGRADLLHLPFADNSVASLSCMHVVEHVGLERYGDSFDPRGDLKAMKELTRVLAPQGHLYFVVPMGNKARVQYNAHRIYLYKQILNAFSSLKLIDFSFVTNHGEFIEAAQEQDTLSSTYGCGCFDFVK